LHREPGFDEIRLGDAVTFQRGFDITKNEQSEGVIPIVSSSGVSSFHNQWKTKGPGVVIGRKGTLGTVHYLKGNFWPHDTTLWVKDFKGNNPRFISYFLKPLHLENFDTGSSNPTLNRNHIHKIKVIFPKPHIQQKIAAGLSVYDDLIETNKRRIALLEKMAEEVYREWFVRLRFPGHEKVRVVKGVPEGWEQKRFGAFCVLQRGHDLPDANVEPGPYPVAASTSIKTYHNQYKAKPPVITTGRSGSLGTVMFINEKTWPLNTCLYVKDFCGNSYYLIYYTLKNMGLENFNAGAGVPTLNRNHLNGIPLVVPPKPLQDRFDEIIAPIFRQKELIEQSNKVLCQTRDSLLPRLISGKLSVENLDIQFPPGMGE
jgi:type I restriction enzyme S subunit